MRPKGVRLVSKMCALPSGTVTLLFTDIEGGTQLLGQLGPRRYNQLIVEHRRVLRRAFADHCGSELRTEGDSFFAAFARASEAVAAAEQAQHSLVRMPLKVRVGIHSGEPMLVEHEDGYVGIDVHRAARIMSAGHGGQVLLSQATRDLLDERLELRDLGEHRLKDLSEPMRIYQLGDGEFPPLRSISNTNLPRPASSFIGRERELREVKELLRRNEVRLLTLTGPGGTGKTRLALEAAGMIVADYPGGVFWVALASLRDPALVSGKIAQVLGAKDALAEHIGERRLLLVLDNLEQVIEAAPEFSALLERCPNLTLLITSRELLQLRGELEYPVPPLTDVEAVALFCERAHLNPNEEIKELCARLDSLPLAVELAAARARILSPAQILKRLSQRLDVLKGGRDADPRQQTLRTTVEWSYELLSSNEQHLFARFSVFAGGCTLEAAEAVCEADLDTLQGLVDKSLLRYANERFWMLETIRDFAAAALASNDNVSRAHADWYMQLAESAIELLYGPEQGSWLQLLEIEHDNLRAALRWLYAAGDTEHALRLSAALHPFWYKHAHIEEGRVALERAVSASARQSPELRARVLRGASLFAGAQDDAHRSEELAEEALAVYRRLGDQRGTALLLGDLGAAAVRRRDYDAASRFYEESIGIFRGIDEPRLLATVIANLGDLAFRKGNLEQASDLIREGLRLQRELGAKFGITISLITLGFVALCQEQHDDARSALEEGMLLAHELGSTDNLAYAFEGFGALAAAEQDWDRAASLIGRAEAIRQSTSTQLEAAEWAVHEETLRAFRAVRSDPELQAAMSSGRTLSDEDAIRLAVTSSMSIRS